MDISKVMAGSGFAMTSASWEGSWRYSVQLGQETSGLPLMLISGKKGDKERGNYTLYVIY